MTIIKGILSVYLATFIMKIVGLSMICYTLGENNFAGKKEVI